MNDTTIVKIPMPELEEGITEDTITKYLVSVGDKIEEDQSILEFSTDKVVKISAFGNLFGTPIINQLQSAFTAIGSLEKKPVVIETEKVDIIGIYYKMFLSHSYDHLVIEGFSGGSFLKRVTEKLKASLEYSFPYL